jgi:hypothetical protein
VRIEPQGTTHYPMFSQVDIHWDRALRLGGNRRLLFNVDVFKATNAATVLARQERQNCAQANYVVRILAPRAVSA